jgi:hypothetical protein
LVIIIIITVVIIIYTPTTVEARIRCDLSIMFFWVKAPCGLVGRKGCFLLLQGWSDEPGLRGTTYVYSVVGSEVCEGKDELGRMGQRPSWINEEAPNRHQKREVRAR